MYSRNRYPRRASGYQSYQPRYRRTPSVSTLRRQVEALHEALEDALYRSRRPASNSRRSPRRYY